MLLKLVRRRNLVRKRTKERIRGSALLWSPLRSLAMTRQTPGNQGSILGASEALCSSDSQARPPHS